MDKKEFLKLKLEEYKTVSNELLLKFYNKKSWDCERLERALNNSNSRHIGSTLWGVLSELKETVKFLEKEIIKRMEK